MVKAGHKYHKAPRSDHFCPLGPQDGKEPEDGREYTQEECASLAAVERGSARRAVNSPALSRS
jgi:hypothetical protein